VWRVVRVPTLAEEDGRQLSRTLETLIQTQTKAPVPQLPSQDVILFDQIRQGLPLIQPADQRGKQHPQRKHVDHGGRDSVSL